MSYVVVTVAGQQTMYANVTRVWSDGRYLHLALAAHPSLVHFWKPQRVLLAGSGPDLTALLREERTAA